MFICLKHLKIIWQISNSRQSSIQNMHGLQNMTSFELQTNETIEQKINLVYAIIKYLQILEKINNKGVTIN